MSEQETPLSAREIEWRYTARRVRVGPFDANVVLLPMLLFMFHIHWWTFFIALMTVVVLYFVELFLHMPLADALRSLRSALAGRHRAAVPWWKQKSL